MKQSAAELQFVGHAIFSLYSLGCSPYELERKLKKVPGIAEVYVNYVADIVELKFDANKIKIDEIRAFMMKLGSDTGAGRSSLKR